MVCCSVCGTSMTKKNVKDGITWHKFPKNEMRKVSWLKQMKMPEYWSPTPSSRLCSKHFTDDCFDRTSSVLVRLFPTAVPTIQINRLKHARNSNEEVAIQEIPILLTLASTSRESDILMTTSDTPTESTIESKSHSSAFTSNSSASTYPPGLISPTQTSLSSRFTFSPIETSNEETIQNLKRKFTDSLRHKNKRIKILQQKVYHQNKKIVSLKSMLLELKKKNMVTEDTGNLLLNNFGNNQEIINRLFKKSHKKSVKRK